VARLTAQHSSKSRRSGRDAEATQRHILDAAEAEFSRHGLKGARIDAIAKGAGVTTAMIHYYFKNKEGLYKAVLQRPIDEIQTTFTQIDLDQLAPEAALQELMRVAIAAEAANPYRQMLWFQEASQNRGKYFKQGNWPDVFSQMHRVLERGIRDGYFRPVDTSLTLIHILSVCIFYFTIHENWKHLTPDIDRLSPEMVERHTQAATELVLAGLRSSTDWQGETV
jgi:TetR/AcrR family transcriptional regulator